MRILVTGAPRSGTTWTGQLLGCGPSSRYVHEPFNSVAPPAGSGFRADLNFLRLDPGRDRTKLRQIERLLEGRWTLPAFRWRDLTRPRHLGRRLRDSMLLPPVKPGDRVIMKDPLACLSADVLCRNLSMQCVVMVRRPEAVISSFLSRNWDFASRNFLGQRDRLSGILTDADADELASLEGSKGREAWIRRISIMWRVVNARLQRQVSECPGWVVVSHEQVLEDGLGSAIRLFERLQLPFGEPERRFVEATRSEGRSAPEPSVVRPVMDVRRDIGSVKGIAERRLEASEIRLIRQMCEPVHERWAPHFG